MEWTEMVKYVDAGILLLIVILFIKGYIVSRKTIDDIKKEIQKERENFKITLDIICETHKQEIKGITNSFEKRIKDFMKIIKVLKKQNNIK